MGDPWEVYAFDELHCGHGLHQDTLLGNSDAIADATLTALWLFLLPIFKQLLNRRKQQKMVKVYFFLAFVYIRYYQPTTRQRLLSAGFIGVGQRPQYQEMHSMTTLCKSSISVPLILMKSRGVIGSALQIITSAPQIGSLSLQMDFLN